MIRPGIERQTSFQCLYFIADMHALTTNRQPELLQSQTLDIVATWLALGFDPKQHIMYRQSDIPFVAEFAWYLSCVTGFGLLEKSHAFKDAQAQAKDVSHAVFAYPVLMAADIVMYDADIVPVGKDQKQHVEMARDMAGSFNAVYGADVIKLPEPVIDERVMTIPGLDGRKMSKSYGNEIPLFCDEKALRKCVLSIKTDSTPLEAPKTLKGTLISDLYTLFGTQDQYADLEKRLAAGGLGWGHAKDELFQVINDHVKDARARYMKLRTEEPALQKILDDGARRAFEVSEPVLNRVRKAVGFRKVPTELYT
jgi:tryptophanyl-tRNA synthetase